MDYNKVNYLFTLRSTAAIFGYLHLNLSQMLFEKDVLYASLDADKKNVFMKIFNRSLYKTRQHNLGNSISRAEAIIDIFESNPNKATEQNITLSEIIQKAVDKATKYSTKKEVESMQLLAGSRIHNMMNVDELKISIKPEHVYFEEETVKPSFEKAVVEKTNKTVKNTENEIVL